MYRLDSGYIIAYPTAFALSSLFTSLHGKLCLGLNWPRGVRPQGSPIFSRPLRGAIPRTAPCPNVCPNVASMLVMPAPTCWSAHARACFLNLDMHVLNRLSTHPLQPPLHPAICDRAAGYHPGVRKAFPGADPECTWPHLSLALAGTSHGIRCSGFHVRISGVGTRFSGA